MFSGYFFLFLYIILAVKIKMIKLDGYIPPNIYRWIAENFDICKIKKNNHEMVGFVDETRGLNCIVCPKILPNAMPKFACAERIRNFSVEIICHKIPIQCQKRLLSTYKNFSFKTFTLKNSSKIFLPSSNQTLDTQPIFPHLHRQKEEKKNFANTQIHEKENQIVSLKKSGSKQSKSTSSPTPSIIVLENSRIKKLPLPLKLRNKKNKTYGQTNRQIYVDHPKMKFMLSQTNMLNRTAKYMTRPKNTSRTSHLKENPASDILTPKKTIKNLLLGSKNSINPKKYGFLIAAKKDINKTDVLHNRIAENELKQKIVDIIKYFKRKWSTKKKTKSFGATINAQPINIPFPKENKVEMWKFVKNTIDKNFGEKISLADYLQTISIENSKMNDNLKEEISGNSIQDVPKLACYDSHELCCFWAINGECERNPDFMNYNCAKSCSACGCSIFPDCTFAMEKCNQIKIPYTISTTHPTLIYSNHTQFTTISVNTEDPTNFTEISTQSTTFMPKLIHTPYFATLRYTPYMATLIPRQISMKNAENQHINILKKTKNVQNKIYRDTNEKNLIGQKMPEIVKKIQEKEPTDFNYAQKETNYQLFDLSEHVPLGKIRRLDKAWAISEEEVQLLLKKVKRKKFREQQGFSIKQAFIGRKINTTSEISSTPMHINTTRRPTTITSLSMDDFPTPQPFLTNNCMDYDPRCKEFSERNECQRNPIWMLINCPSSCNECGVNFYGIYMREVQFRSEKNCIDFYILCPVWWYSGECKKNPIWMNKYCRLSCVCSITNEK